MEQRILCITRIEYVRRRVKKAKKPEYDVEKRKRKGTRKQRRKNSAMVNGNRGGNSCGAHLVVDRNHLTRRRYLDRAHYCNHFKIFAPNSCYIRTPLCPVSRSKLLPVWLAGLYPNLKRSFLLARLLSILLPALTRNPSDDDLSDLGYASESVSSASDAYTCR